MNKFNHIFSRYIKKIDIFHKITLRAPKKHTIFWQPANWLFVLIFERVYFYLKQNFTKCQYSLFNRPFRKLTQSVCLLQKKNVSFFAALNVIYIMGNFNFFSGLKITFFKLIQHSPNILVNITVLSVLIYSFIIQEFTFNRHFFK